MKGMLHQGAAPFLQRSILPRCGHRVFTFFWWPWHSLCFFSSEHLLWTCTSTVCVCVVCVSVSVCVSVCEHAQVHVFVYAVYVRIHVCVYMCICKCMRMHMYVEAKSWYRVLSSIAYTLSIETGTLSQSGAHWFDWTNGPESYVGIPASTSSALG